MEPAAGIISRFGGPTALGKILGVHRTRVANWKRPSSVGGTNGRIPQKYHRTLLDVASTAGFDLTAEDFLSPQDEGKAA